MRQSNRDSIQPAKIRSGGARVRAAMVPVYMKEPTLKVRRYPSTIVADSSEKSSTATLALLCAEQGVAVIRRPAHSDARAQFERSIECVREAFLKASMERTRALPLPSLQVRSKRRYRTGR